MLLFPEEFKISRSLKKQFGTTSSRSELITIFDPPSNPAPRPNAHEESTWIESDMIEDYAKLHELGIAHSIEAYQNGKLTGGLYGLSMGSLLGESMFHLVPEASKACLAKLVEIATGVNFPFIDCQVHNPHLESSGCP